MMKISRSEVEHVSRLARLALTDNELDALQGEMDAILSYAENDRYCRTAMILEYFGEHNFQDCGHCDQCLDKKRKSSVSDHKHIRDMVQYQLRKGPRLPEDLTSVFEDHEISTVEEIIREMTDRDELGYDQLGRLIK